MYRFSFRLLIFLLPAFAVGGARAAETAPPDQDQALFGQVTNVTQWHPAFRSPYQGDNSLNPTRRSAETTDITVYAGFRLWRGAEFWLNPEIDQGFGLSDTLGAAGFPSGEAYKVGANKPYLRLPRAFLRQTINLGGETEKQEAAANQLPGSHSADNLVITFGKFGVPDVFDTNRYAHDPRADFLNWSLIDAGAFDYAADSWGFTYGAAAEWTQSWWTLRAGIFQLSPVPNGKVIAPRFHQHMWVSEAEGRGDWLGRPGKIKLTLFANQGRMGSYRDAVALARVSGDAPDTALVRKVATNTGYVLNLEQELTADLGAFARFSRNNGRYEAYEFTEINQSFSAGLALKGAAWGRANDTWGLALAQNALSSDARAYFAAGGMGILIGDGALNYAGERIVETYYALQFNAHATLSLDYQRLTNPAHNRDRGPVPLYAARLHIEF